MLSFAYPISKEGIVIFSPPQTNILGRMTYS